MRRRTNPYTVLFIYLLIAAAILFTIVIYKINNTTVKTEVSVKSKPIVKSDTVTNGVKMVSKIIEFDTNMKNKSKPSYAKPETYKIAKTLSGYAVMLPGGTLCDERYKTPEEAQIQIYEMAKMSENNWIKSGGTNW